MIFIEYIFYRYLLKLRSIDMMRKDGAFYDDEGIKIEGKSFKELIRLY